MAQWIKPCRASMRTRGWIPNTRNKTQAGMARQLEGGPQGRLVS